MLARCLLSTANEAAAAAGRDPHGQRAAADGRPHSGDARGSTAFLSARRHGARLWSVHHQGGEGVEGGSRWTETRRPGELTSIL